MHGGTAPVGPASSAWKHGRYSRALRGALGKAYLNAMDDPQLLSLRDDIALTAARIEGVLDQALAGAEAVDAVRRAWEGVRRAVGTRDPVRIQQAMDACQAAVDRAGEAAVALREVERLQAHRARLSQVEHARAIAAATTVDAAAAWALVQHIIELVRTHVPDPVARRAVADGLVRLAGADARQRPA